MLEAIRVPWKTPRSIRVHGRISVALTALALFFVSSTVAKASDWVPLFDGFTLNGWTQQNGQPVTEKAWQVVDGVVHLDVSQGRGGNIITDRDYGDFELTFEWKIASRGNSGIKYRVKDFGGRVLGCEYQIIDDQDYGDLRPAQTTAALYDLFEPKPHNVLRPPGEFNRGAILVYGNQIEHWLNGHLLVRVTVGSDDWRQRVAQSKFADVDGFGENQWGRLMLTDHGDEVWFRNVFIRSLRPASSAGESWVTTGGQSCSQQWLTSHGHRTRRLILARPGVRRFCFSR